MPNQRQIEQRRHVMRKFLLGLAAVAALAFVTATPRLANAQGYYQSYYSPAYSYPTYSNGYYGPGYSYVVPSTAYYNYTPMNSYVTPSYSYVTPSYSYVTPSYGYAGVGVGPVWYGSGYGGYYGRGWRGRYWRR
jgi:hypothetical protein